MLSISPSETGRARRKERAPPRDVNERETRRALYLSPAHRLRGRQPLTALAGESDNHRRNVSCCEHSGDALKVSWYPPVFAAGPLHLAGMRSNDPRPE